MSKLERGMGHVKQWSKSKTLNFGVLLQAVAGMQAYVDGLGNPLATMIVGVIIIVLRFKTDQSVQAKL